MTKRLRFKKNLTGLLSLLYTIGPLVVFVIMGYINGEGKEKVVLTLTMIAAIAMAVIAVLRKVNLRSTTYILVIGLWVALDNLLPFVLTLAICTLCDELIFTPLHHRFKEDYHTNKQLDKRLNP
jgi:uncharacterized Tic20 family protein